MARYIATLVEVHNIKVPMIMMCFLHYTDNGDTNSQNGVKMSASTDNMDDHSTTTTTFKPPATPEIPLGKLGSYNIPTD